MEHESAKWKNIMQILLVSTQTFLTVVDLSSFGQGKKKNINIIYF